MADVSHELGALRFVVDSPLSSKVAMFNNAVTKHQQSQHLNPFSQSGGLPKPTFKKDEYGKPLAGSLTEMRGQKANIHVLKEMLELCQIIDSEGYNVKDEPTMKVIPFGELFNIYTYISDKVVGILLRARKHKLVEFEGEVLFQRRDDDVPIFLLKPIQEIRRILEQKQDEIRRSVSPAPQATTVMMDQQKRSLSLSPTPSKKLEKSVTPEKPTKPEKPEKPEIRKPVVQKPSAVAPPTITVQDDQCNKEESAPKEALKPAPEVPNSPSTASTTDSKQIAEISEKHEQVQIEVEPATAASAAAVEASTVAQSTQTAPPQTIVTPPTPTAESAPAVATSELNAVPVSSPVATPELNVSNPKTDINNNAEGVATTQTADASSNTENEPPTEGPSQL